MTSSRRSLCGREAVPVSRVHADNLKAHGREAVPVSKGAGGHVRRPRRTARGQGL